MKHLITLLLVCVFVGLLIFIIWGIQNNKITSIFDLSTFAPPANASKYFQNKISTLIDINVGKPIEGYEPRMFFDVLPGLKEKDFNGVEAESGTYRYQNDTLTFVPETGVQSSAGKSITDRGMSILLVNISKRLEKPGRTEKDVDVILATLQGPQYETGMPGRIIGTLLIGPICPVERVDVPCPVPIEAYQARPIIISNLSGKEITRVTAGTDGKYIVEISPGAYVVSVYSASSIEHTQPQQVAVESDKDVIVNFSVDTGIR